MRNRLWVISLLACVVGTVAACSEDLTGTAGCPELCPEQDIDSRDTILDAFLTVDTTVTGYPVLGTETFLLVATRGDTLDARAVMRFDTLAQRFNRGGADSAIYAVDSSMVTVRLDTTGTKATAPVTVEIYDVDSAAMVDTATSVVLSLFRPDRLIGGKTFAVAELKDTLRVPLMNDKVLAKLTGEAPRRLRIGFRVTSSASAQIRLVSRDGGVSSQISYDPSPDTLVKALVNSQASLTPVDNPTLRNDLTDYQVVAKGQGAGAGSFIGVGGLPAQRAYFRFDVPRRLVDTMTVVRATLMLTQIPTNSVDASDTITIYPQIVRASVDLQDVVRSAGILSPPLIGIDSIRVKPNDSGRVSIEMVGALRQWQAVGATTLQRAIVLRSATEGASAPSVLFYSAEAGPSQRPKLRITYVSKVEFGVP